MALLNLDDDPWLLEFYSSEKLQNEIMEQLNLRQQKNRNTETHSRISANIRLRLKQYDNEINQLNVKLDDVSKTRSITYDEIERRRHQIEKLQSAGLKMHRIFNEVPSNSYQERSLLIGSSDWNTSDDQMLDAAAGPHSIDDIRKQKQVMLQEQERGLEDLSKIIARQKNIAQTISSEVDLQNDIIDDLGDHIDRTDARIHNETRNVSTIDRKDKTCIYWVIIVLLFLSIVTVLAI